MSAISSRLRGFVFLVAVSSGWAAGSSVAADVSWQRREVNWSGPGGLRIVAINEPAPVRTFGPATLDAPSPVPIAGFVPYVAIATTNAANTGEFVYAHVMANTLTGTALNAPLSSHYAIGVVDTGATQHVIAERDWTSLGLNGMCLDGPCLTGNTIPLGGAGGGTVDADVTERLGLFVAGLGAVNPATLALDTTKLSGHWNVSAAAIPPGTCALGPILPTLVGTPLWAFRDFHIRHDNLISIERSGVTYDGPEVQVYPLNSPLMPTYRRAVPLDLRPAGLTTSAYYPYIFELDFETPWIPTSLASLEGEIPSGGWFFASVALQHGSSSELSRMFMFDTGAQVSVIRSFLAGQLGLNLNRPDFTADVLGITCNVTTAKGFYINTFKIDAFGGPIVLHHVPVIVQDLPTIDPPNGTLDGIVGTNLFVGHSLAFKPSIGGGSVLEVSRLYGDFDGDGDVDGSDYGFFAGCFNGTGNPVSAACDDADADGDFDVDGSDYGFFAGCFNGTGNPAAPGCPQI